MLIFFLFIQHKTQAEIDRVKVKPEKLTQDEIDQ